MKKGQAIHRKKTAKIRKGLMRDMLESLGTVPVPETMLAAELGKDPKRLYAAAVRSHANTLYPIRVERYYWLNPETLHTVRLQLAEQESEAGK